MKSGGANVIDDNSSEEKGTEDGAGAPGNSDLIDLDNSSNVIKKDSEKVVVLEGEAIAIFYHMALVIFELSELCISRVLQTKFEDWRRF